MFLPIVIGAMGDASTRVVGLAYEDAAIPDLDQPRVREEVIRAVSSLAPDPTSDAGARLLRFSGEALFDAGRPEEARRVLTRAVETLARDRDPQDRDEAAQGALLLARAAAAVNDEPGARAWALRALAVALQPEEIADHVLVTPSLSRYVGEPGWEPLRRIARDLVTVGSGP